MTSPSLEDSSEFIAALASLVRAAVATEPAAAPKPCPRPQT